MKTATEVTATIASFGMYHNDEHAGQLREVETIIDAHIEKLLQQTKTQDVDDREMSGVNLPFQLTDKNRSELKTIGYRIEDLATSKAMDAGQQDFHRITW
jgi:hypothetical protein